eukprot:SAG11_NODE_1626_length_4552_cov_21.053223_3_plen_187_part_00
MALVPVSLAFAWRLRVAQLRSQGMDVEAVHLRKQFARITYANTLDDQLFAAYQRLALGLLDFCTDHHVILKKVEFMHRLRREIRKTRDQSKTRDRWRKEAERFLRDRLDFSQRVHNGRHSTRVLGVTNPIPTLLECSHQNDIRLMARLHERALGAWADWKAEQISSFDDLLDLHSNYRHALIANRL